MSKKKEPENIPDQSTDIGNLTPWQKANRKYLAEHGEKSPEDKPNSESKTKEDVPKEISEVNKDQEIQNETTKKQPLDFEEIEQKKVGGPYNGSFLDRLPNLKTQRNKVLYRRLGLIITVLLIPLVFLIYYVSPFSKLEAISVSGNEVVSKEEILKDTQLKIHEHVWHQYWHRDEAINRLKKDQPRIKTAKLSFSGVNTFNLAVTEYKEIALILKNGKYYPVIEDGTVLSQNVANPTKNLPILEGFTDSKKIKDLAEAYNKLSPELQKAISEIKYTPRESNKQLIQLNMNDGNQVIVNITNLATQMNYYSQVASEMKEKGVIDMEVGIFSYPYPQEDEETATNQSTNDETSTSPSESTEPASESPDNGNETNPEEDHSVPTSSNLDEN
ncbi:FtsQ-type POTRA domain-containing protein [Enterococcus hirae]|nr:FtsQ-type POTRA domain-containing protein [Enterococcus hirae]